MGFKVRARVRIIEGSGRKENTSVIYLFSFFLPTTLLSDPDWGWSQNEITVIEVYIQSTLPLPGLGFELAMWLRLGLG